MKDDTSEIINNASCYTINSQTSIYAYRNNVRSTYTQIGGRWLKTAEQTYTNLPNNSVCFSYTDIQGLNSFAVYEPVLNFISFCLCGLVIYLFFRLIRGFLYGFSAR